MRKFIYISLLVAVSISISPAQDIEDTLMIFGRDRFFKIHLPLGYNLQQEYPLVLVFHGGLGNPDNIEKTTDFSFKADKEGFIVVYPYGTGAFPKKLLTWNTWDCCGYANKKNIDDVAFVKKLLDKIKSEYRVNNNMIYAAGFSNGGMMCYLLACQIPEEFAAVAPVAATMFNEDRCPAKSETSMIIFNSVDDKHIPYDGGVGEQSLVDVEKMPVENVVNFWAEKYHCDFINKSETNLFHKIIYKNHKDTEIIFYKMLKGGHSWPGGVKGRVFTDTPVKNVSATDLIWDFFKNHIKK